MKTLEIRWQRLVDAGGQTCERCGTTGEALEEAVDMLGRSLGELGIDIVLEKESLGMPEFNKDPLASNRVWIAGQPLEKWLSATTGQSRCCSSCGDSDCRTITVDGTTYEAIPAELIVRAGLLAGADLLAGEAAGACCSPGANTPGGSGCCPPSSRDCAGE